MENIIVDNCTQVIIFSRKSPIQLHEWLKWDTYFRENGYTKQEKTISKSIRNIDNTNYICRYNYNFYYNIKTVKTYSCKYTGNMYMRLEEKNVNKMEYITRSPLSQITKNLKSLIYSKDGYEFIIENGTLLKLEFNSVKNFEHVYYTIYSMISDSIIKNYQKLTDNERFAGTMPTTFEVRHDGQYSLNFGGYSITNKLDGMRYNIFIDAHGRFYLIDRQLTCKVIDGLCDVRFANSILDCEKVNGKYHCFDILYDSNVDIGDKSLDIRLNHLSEIITRLDNPKFSVKTFHLKYRDGVYKYPGNIKTNHETIYDIIHDLWMTKTPDMDGLIFNRIDSPFYNNDTYKWKNDHTVDLQCKTIGDKTRLYVQTSTEVIPFDKRCKLFHHHDGIVDCIGHDDCIAEFKLDFTDKKLKIIFVKLRPEKLLPNHVGTIANIWNAVKRGVDIEWFMNKKSKLLVNADNKETPPKWRRAKV